MGTTGEPLSDARLAEIREDALFDAATIHYARRGSVMQELLAEVERLRAREAALVAVVKKVATAYQPTKYSYGSVSSRTVEQARALLDEYHVQR